MHFICSDSWLEGLLADDCPGLDLTVELLGIGAAQGNQHRPFKGRFDWAL